MPLLGVCLGIQLFAKAEGSAVYPLPGSPEIGWVPVELTEAAADDPVFGSLPRGFDAFGWHYYTYDVPERADVMVTGPRCNQAFRLGERAWGIQFHAEVTLETVRMWLDDKDDFPLDLDRDARSSADRFDWMYSAEELAEWVEPLAELAGRSQEVYALMNNNKSDYAPRSAQILRGLLDEHGIEATGGVEPPMTGQLQLGL